MYTNAYDNIDHCIKKRGKPLVITLETRLCRPTALFLNPLSQVGDRRNAFEIPFRGRVSYVKMLVSRETAIGSKQRMSRNEHRRMYCYYRPIRSKCKRPVNRLIISSRYLLYPLQASQYQQHLQAPVLLLLQLPLPLLQLDPAVWCKSGRNSKMQ